MQWVFCIRVIRDLFNCPVYVCLTFQHLSTTEAQGNVTEYRAFVIHNAGTAVVVDGHNVSRAPASQHFIRWQMSAQSSYHVAVVAYTAAGCNPSLKYNVVRIPTQKQGVRF